MNSRGLLQQALLDNISDSSLSLWIRYNALNNKEFTLPANFFL